MKIKHIRGWAVAGLLLVLSMPALAAPNPNEPAAAPSPQVMSLMRQGVGLFQQGDYAQSIDPLGKALALEKRQPTLNKSMWRVLVDLLGMAYGISGDVAHAKATYAYGLGKDPTYPMFYYNLACTYAEADDLDKVIRNLKLAFKYKANMIPGEAMPDPAQDDSFQKYLANDRFKQALKDIRN